MPEPTLADSPPLFIVFNARSGRGDAQALRRAIAEACSAAGRAHELLAVDHPSRLPERSGEAVRRARSAGGVVVVAGGDGTINAVAQHVLGSGCAFGVLPQGTFNYFSRTHGIPSDTAQALEALLKARPRAVRVGLVNERMFLVNASLGLYATLLEEREAFKSRYGRSRAIAFVAALSTLLFRGHRLWDLRVSWRNRDWDIRTPTLFVGNNALQLERVGMPESQALQDGELAGIALKPVGVLSMLWLMARGVFGRLGAADDIVSISFKSMTVKSSRARAPRRIKVAADGEIQWMDMPLHIRVADEPLWLMKPDAAGHEAQA